LTRQIVDTEESFMLRPSSMKSSIAMLAYLPRCGGNVMHRICGRVINSARLLDRLGRQITQPITSGLSDNSLAVDIMQDVA